jgi:hypothetical protein
MGGGGRPRYLAGKYLAPDERVLKEVHASRWFFFWRPTVVLTLVLLGEFLACSVFLRGMPQVPMVSSRAVALTAVFGSLGASQGPTVYLVVLVTTAILATIALFFVWRDWASTLYVVTNDRLIKQLGFFWRDTEEIGLRHVRSVDIYQAAPGASILNYGTLQIRSLSDVRFAEKTGSFVGKLHGVTEIDPYIHPKHPLTDEQGCEWWFSIADPVGVQRTIEHAIEKLEQGEAFASPSRGGSSFSAS